ncbi:uncharacterized protein LOC104897305 [Beta vulgaris subsp. vulgaris]|uniref:uncharacterized protein LOC104897305 n=1 Tax=Beta vulgaris subsp. vulgaris TaxID=3555 RepID=UPI00203752FE|nr:uncharacterized protein LOC104897305 [Beta vulgaris subsp. vulgaris]
MAEPTSSEIEIQNKSTQIHEASPLLNDDDLENLFGPGVVDYTTPSSWAVVKLPQFFLLKGDNGRYLKSAPDSNNNPTNMFIANDKMDATVFEVVPLSDGSVGIRSTFYNRFLASVVGQGTDIHGIHTTVAQLEDDWRSRFWPVKLGRGTDTRLIGLRLFQNRMVGSRCRNFGPTLGASNGPATKSAGFELEEAVSQRQIYGVTYHMDQAKISDHEPLTSVTKDVMNWSKTPQKGVLSFSHTERESHSWGSTDSWKISASVGMSVRIPFVKSTDITTEAYYSGAYEWGEEQETAKEIGTQLEVEVPPMSMVQATMIVQKGKLEVPFSYGQRDTLYNGYTSLTNLPDGLFTSVNTYVTYETTKRSLA